MGLNLDKQITQNFKLGEFIISKFYDERQQKKVIQSVDTSALENIHKLANNLQFLRNKLNAPIIINIAYRPLWYELEMGRSGTSQHVFGKAADIKVVRYTTRQVYDTIEKLIDNGDMLQGGLGYYPSFIHYDLRRTKARW